MTDLVKVENGVELVSARDLYRRLDVKTDFTDWCKRMFEYGFEDGTDFTSILGKSSGGRPSADYALTVDCAKEISMLQRTPQGKVVRLHLIDCEKRLRALTVPVAKEMSPLDYMQFQLDLMKKQDARIELVEEKVLLIEAKQNTSDTGYYAIAGYAAIINRRIDLPTAAVIGKKASSMCKKLGFIMGTVPDPRFGTVNTYPKEVLKCVFESHV